MKKLMVLVAFLVVALVAAPAIAQDGESTTPLTTPVSGASGGDPGATLPEASQEDTAQEAPPKVEDLVSDTSDDASTNTGDDSTSTDPGPGEDASDDGTSTGPGDVTSTGTGDTTSTDTDAADDKGNGTVEDAAKDADDDVTKDEIADIDAEDREDRIADRILADLKDSKKDEKQDEKENEKEDDAKDGKKDKDDDDADDNNEDGVEQSTDQDADSGDTDQDADVINTGDNVNQCVAILQVANTGNAQNANGVVQYDSEADEIELEDGSTIDITPRLVLKCKQVIRQVVKSERIKDSDAKKLRSLLQPRGNAPIIRTGGVPNRVSNVPGRVSNVPGRVNTGAVVPTSRLSAAAAPKVLSASRAGQPKAASLKSLPRTGGFSGYATLLGLSAGVLLVGGGLLVRRLSR